MSLPLTRSPLLPAWGLLFGATSWGLVWFPYRLLEQAGFPALVSSLYTFVVELGVGLILFALLRWPCRGLGSAGAIGLALAAGWTNMSYVLAVVEGTVVRVMLLFYLSPLWTLLLARLLLREPAGRGAGLIVALSVGGAMVMLWVPGAGLPLPASRAEWMGLSSGIGFALTNVLTRKYSALEISTKSVAVWGGSIFVTLLVLPFNPDILLISPVPDGGHLALVLGVGVLLMFTTVVVQYGVTHTPVVRASVIFLFELVVAAWASWALAGESSGLREWCGGAMIVMATLCAAWLERDAVRP